MISVINKVGIVRMIFVLKYVFQEIFIFFCERIWSYNSVVKELIGVILGFKFELMIFVYMSVFFIILCVFVLVIVSVLIMIVGMLFIMEERIVVIKFILIVFVNIFWLEMVWIIFERIFVNLVLWILYIIMYMLIEKKMIVYGVFFSIFFVWMVGFFCVVIKKKMVMIFVIIDIGIEKNLLVKYLINSSFKMYYDSLNMFWFFIVLIGFLIFVRL